MGEATENYCTMSVTVRRKTCSGFRFFCKMKLETWTLEQMCQKQKLNVQVDLNTGIYQRTNGTQVIFTIYPASNV